MAFDWNASGLTVVTLAALKEALRSLEKDLDVYIAGGKGKTSRKTPDQIISWSDKIGLSQKISDTLVYSSKAAAKVDSALVQDGYQLYHHSFIFNKSGFWSVVQQGMNTKSKSARRYHWLSSQIDDFVEEPHFAISTQSKEETVLDLTAKISRKNKQISLELLKDEKSFYRDLKIIEDKKTQSKFKILNLPGIEFNDHPVNNFDFSPQFKTALNKAIISKPSNFESLLMTQGVGPRTIRSLSLVAEVIYGASPSYDDPARYSFSFGGKDATPYPVDYLTYDKTLNILEKAIAKAKLPYSEKEQTFKQIGKLSKQFDH